MKSGIKICFILGMAASQSLWAEVAYQIDLTSPEHRLAKVSVTFPETQGELMINLPVWRPGKYQVLPLADGLRQFQAFDDNSKRLAWTRSGKGEWKIHVPEVTEVMVRYQIHGDLLGYRIRHIDATHAFLNASGVFVYSPQYRHEPITVDLDVPRGWKSYSGMESGWRHTFEAANYDVLMDSPIETGINQHRSFVADNRNYELVVWGEGNYNLKQITKDLQALSSTAASIWDDYPFERYLYMVHATSGERGATEHINSTIIQLPRFSFRERKDYLRFMATAAHEFIHSWNVKAYRPQGLVPYDYQQETLTPLLWIAEGSTSYFQYQLLLRAGIATPKEFFADLARRIDRNLNTPGREQQSMAEASQTAWISTGGDYAINHSISIYSEGYLTSLALDFSILKETHLESSYRDVHRQLYRDFRLPKGYSVTDVKSILNQLTGKDYETWWQAHVDTPLSLDYDALLALAGLQLSYSGKPKPYLGVILANDALTLEHVKRDSPAWRAGLHADDEILAINGLKVTATGFNKRIRDFQIGDEIAITLFTNDQLKTLMVTLGQQHSGKAKIRALDNVSKQQKAFLKAWLGIDWPFNDEGQFIPE